MKKISFITCCICITSLMTIGCTNTQVGTTTGAAAGAGLGYAVGQGWAQR